MSDFGTSYAEATVLVLSSHAVLADILDHPGDHGFAEDDASTAPGRGIWVDDLHLTEEVHELLAEKLCDSVFVGVGKSLR